MEVFKNKVGRPSNEFLKKRKQAKILIAVSVIFVIGILFYGGYSLLNVTGISKNVSASGGTIYISGKSGGFIYSKKYYASGKSVTLGSISKYSNNPNVFLFASDGNTKFNIKGTFGKKFAKSDVNGYPNFIVQSYDVNGKTLETKTTQIKFAGTHTLTLTASKNIHHIRIGVLKSGKQAYNQTIKIGTIPVLEHNPVSRVV